jgi:MFS family permease
MFGAQQDASVRKMIFRTYVLCIFTMVFCVNDPAPLFELFRRAGELSPSELSMLYAVYAGVVIVTLPFFGRASDRLGRRSLVVLGLSFIMIGSLVLAVAGSFASLVGGRLLQGLGIAAMSAPAASALAELAGAQRQAAAASIIAVALAVGGASAPLFSGVAAETFPAFPTASLIFCAGMALASLISVALLPDPWRLRQLGTMPSFRAWASGLNPMQCVERPARSQHVQTACTCGYRNSPWPSVDRPISASSLSASARPGCRQTARPIHINHRPSSPTAPASALRSPHRRLRSKCPGSCSTRHGAEPGSCRSQIRRAKRGLPRSWPG